MLQQTQVNTVVDYYLRFGQAFPTVHHLARAKPGAVMKMWEGLGYYSRARHMHAAAKIIVDVYDGRIPDSYSDLIALPGIGRYTAGAILSMAYGQSIPVLDGNIMRILTRLYHITECIDIASTQASLWHLAEQHLQQVNPSAMNQAMMELGALICKPRAPQCALCPVQSLCQASALSLQAELPVRKPRKRVPHYDVTAAVIFHGEKILITLRPAKGLLGGLWEFPGGKLEPGEELQACLLRELKEELAIDIAIDRKIMTIPHAYTHFKITLHVFQAVYQGGDIVCHAADAYQWVLPSMLPQFAFPAADRKVIDYLTEQNSSEKP